MERKIAIILVAIVAVLVVLSSTYLLGEKVEIQNEFACVSDADCIPLPSECHPMSCINKAYEANYVKPEICTMIYMYEAAYNPEDCACVNNICTNKNLGRVDSSNELLSDEMPPML